MKKVLKLTDRDGKVCLVNFKKFEQVVSYSYRDEKYTKVHFNRGYSSVVETPEEIYDKLYPNVLDM